MARFFFHTDDGASRADIDGVELPDHRSAQREGLRTLGQLLMDESDQIMREHGIKLIVTDAAGLILFVLDLSAVTAPALGRPGA